MRLPDQDPGLFPGSGGEGLSDAGEFPPMDRDLARADRLRAIRQMIDEGTYETTERLEGAVSRFLSAAGE